MNDILKETIGISLLLRIAKETILFYELTQTNTAQRYNYTLLHCMMGVFDRDKIKYQKYTKGVIQY